MIISPSKIEDIRWRHDLLQQMHSALRDNLPITAKEIGKTTAWLADRIKSHDYSREDAILKNFPLGDRR